MEREFILKGLNCPNCSAKIQNEVKNLYGVRDAEFNLITQTLTVKSEIDIEILIKKIEKIVKSHEPDVEVIHIQSDEDEDTHENNKADIYRIIIGAVFFVLGLILEGFTKISIKAVLEIFVLAYIIIGYKVLYKAARNVFRGRMLDENFLMSVSSVAAFCIGSWSEAVAVMLFYNIGEYFQELAVKKSRKSISELMDICPDTANIVRDGKIYNVPCEAVEIGDTLIIKPGEKVPLDSVVEKGESELDMSALTGESKLRMVTTGCEILSGTINKNGVLNARVTKIFSESTASKIIKMVEGAANKKAPTENFITTFSRVYTPTVVIAALLIAIIPSLIFGDFGEWIRRACVFLVISCPCALVISVPLTFFGGIGAASKKGILVKGGNYLEALSRLKVVVFDKTGTLTKGEFGIKKIIAASGITEIEVLRMAATAEQFSNHPIALSVMNAAKECGELIEVLETKDVPGFGIEVKTQDTEIAVGSEELMRKLGIEIENYIGTETVIYVGANKKYLGAIALIDKVKEDAKEGILTLKTMGISKTLMLTGDVSGVAEAVAEEVGIDEFYAELLPEDKVKYFEKIKKEANGIAGFVGDGINDAPVLALSDVGIAMGGLGSDAAIEAADVVIMNDEPSKVAEAVWISKETKKIVIQNIVFSLTVKGVFLALGAFGIAGMWEAVFGDVGVMLIAVINAMRVLKK